MAYLNKNTKEKISQEFLENIPEEITKKSLLPTNDVIFHCLFGQVGNERITKDLIEKIINKKVEKIELDLNLNLIREKYDSKLGVLDVRAKTADGINYNIEMQNSSSATLPERILSYWSRLYSGDLKRGNNYDVLSKTIAIIIVNDKIDRFELIKKYHTKWNIREEDYKDIILTEDLEIHIIELPKYKEMRANKENQNIWLEFLLEPQSKEVLKAMADNKEIKEAETKWRKITADDIIRDRALRLEIAELDKNTALKHAREEGLAEGEKNKQIEIARKLLAKEIDIAIIIETTGLSEEEIKELQ
jgi:predicted transposase/invertase (TIGR01784 family)